MCVIVELDPLPTVEEFCEVDDFLACGTPPGDGSFQSVILKNGAAISQYLFALLCLCWDKDYVILDIRDASIVAVYQNRILLHAFTLSYSVVSRSLLYLSHYGSV